MPFVPDQPIAAAGRFVPDALPPAAAPAPARPPAPRRPIGDYNAGMGETGLSLLSGAVALPASGIAGLVASLFPGEGAAADVTRAVGDALTYRPRTEMGNRFTEAAAAPFEALHRAGVGAGERVTDTTGSPALGAGAQTVIEGVLPALIPGAVKGVRRGAGTVADSLEARRMASPEYADPKRLLVEKAQEKELSLPPSQVNPGFPNSALESWAGKIKTGQTISLKNQPTVREMASREAKVPEDVPLSKDAIESTLDREGAHYDAVRNIEGPISADTEYLQSIRNLNSPARIAGEHFEVPNDIATVIKQATPRDGYFTGASAIENIKLLRAKGREAFSGQHPNEPLGHAYFDAAKALEERIARHLEETGADPALIDNFRQSRTNMAKAQDVERALTPGGDVNPQKIAKARNKDAMTGEMADIRDLATEFPSAFQNPANVKGVPWYSPLATRAAAIAHGLSNGNVGRVMADLALIAGEPAARSLITSRPYQKLFVQHPGSAGVIERLARAVAPDAPGKGPLSLAPPGPYIPPATRAGRDYSGPNVGDRAMAVADNLSLADEPKPIGNEIDIEPFLRERAMERANAVRRDPAADKAKAEAAVAAATRGAKPVAEAVAETTGVARPKGETKADVKAALEEPTKPVAEAGAGQVERPMDMGELAKLQDEGRMVAKGEKPRIRTAPRDVADRVKGEIYSTPKGPMEWTGTGWKSLKGGSPK